MEAYPNVGRIREGRLPKAAGEIALSGDALQYIGFRGKIGDTIKLSLEATLLINDQPNYEYTADFILTEFLKTIISVM